MPFFAKTTLSGFFGNYFISSNSTSVIIGSWCGGVGLCGARRFLAIEVNLRYI